MARPLLIGVIFTMITVSLQPVSPTKILALIFALIGLSTISCLADSVFLNVDSTPYDRQMSSIQPVLFTTSSTHKENLSLGLVNHLVQELRGIPYGFNSEWKTPAEVE